MWMQNQNPTSRSAVSGLLPWLLFAGAATATEPHAHGHANVNGQPQAQQHAPQPGPHGGQVSATKGHFFEVVFQPTQTRIYVYDSAGRPVSPRGIRGGATMHVLSNRGVFQFPIQPAADSPQPDHLVIAVDLRQVQDGDMRVAFDLTNLPSREETVARFTQTFALAELSPADRALADKQRICPVSEELLGSMGTPIKLHVEGRDVFICCAGCDDALRESPEKFFAKIAN